MFENSEIALADLPDLEKPEWRALQPGYIRRMQVERLLIVLVAGIGSFAPGIVLGDAFQPTVPLWLLVILAAIPLLAWPAISVPRRGFAVREKDIVFRQGVIWRSVTAVPFNRIQHVETSSTPFDRRFGLATLQLFTAGGASGDLKIDGLGEATAEQIRVFILDKTGASIESV